MARLASVSHTKWAFYEAFEADDKETMADYFETLYEHYKKRGRKMPIISLNKTCEIIKMIDKNCNFHELLEVQRDIILLLEKKHREILEHQLRQK